MKVGKHTYGTKNIKIRWGTQVNLTIGNFCSIATNLVIFLGGNHRIDWVSTYPFGIANEKGAFLNKIKSGHPKTNGDVIIGNDVWIGSDVTIMSGVTIGDGAVIGNNSHIVTDVKPYAVVGGNPAKFYYFRFDKETVDQLLELKWWDLPDNQIDELIPFLCSDNLAGLFAVCKKFKQ